MKTPHETEVIDTSRMTPEQRAAMEMTEAAREASEGRGLAGGFFMGEWHPSLPFPLQNETDRDQGDAFLERLEAFLKANVDPDEIDATGEIPDAVLEGLARLGAFGIKVPTEYGGLGLSQTNYCRAAMLLASYCGNLTALISAHQSIGVPQPLLLFGTEEQKQRFLPRVAGGEISAFALTEPGVGSDPARMLTHAEPTEDGEGFVINGEKLWCTNGTKAGVIVVMAKTPARMVEGRMRDQVTAFIVEMDTPGVEVVRRCRFMGLRALFNAVIRFRDVRVPKENILLAEGKGLRVALTTLNTGRLTLPAACAGMTKRALEVTRRWAGARVQWGSPIGHHAAVADRIAQMAVDAFVMESMTLHTASLIDRDLHSDIRLEAAMCKLWASEHSWEAIDAAMQIRGGRGYETAPSQAARGESAEPVERFFRDSRINTIFEGSSEIMRLFIAREALDPHLRVGGPMLNRRNPFSTRLQAGLSATGFYASWYPRLFFSDWRREDWHPRLRRPMRWAEGTGRKLARTLFRAMAWYGPKLEQRQVLLGRFVDIGTELFAMTTTCARAQRLHEGGAVHGVDPLDVAECFCHDARLRVNRWFRDLYDNNDRRRYALARKVLDGEALWLEEGVVNRSPLNPADGSPEAL